MDVKDFSKYLKHRSFDELLHNVRRISLERSADNEFPSRMFHQDQNQHETKKAVNQ